MTENYTQESVHKGLRGWLILFWIYLIVNILGSVFVLFAFTNIYNTDLYLKFASPEAISYIDGVGNIISINILYPIISIPLLLYLFVIFRKKLLVFPKYMSIYLIIPPIVSIVLYFMQSNLSVPTQFIKEFAEVGSFFIKNVGNVIGSVLTSSFLVWYLHTSTRVRNTFIN